MHFVEMDPNSHFLSEARVLQSAYSDTDLKIPRETIVIFRRVFQIRS